MKLKIILTLIFCLSVSAEFAAQSVFNFPQNTQKQEKPSMPSLKENYMSANSDEIFTVGKVTGDIGKTEALFLPKPFYPGEAKADAADGKIYVKVTIDEQGNVVEANSTDGHSALRIAAEESARKSKFRAPTVDGQKIKTDGWLVYNFEIEKPNWVKAAYDLAFLHSPFETNRKLSLAGIKKNLKADWTAENELLARLEELVAQMPKVERFSAPPALVTRQMNVSGNAAKSQMMIRQLPAVPQPNPEQIAVTENLIASLQSRLADDPVALWQYNLAFAILRDTQLRLHPNEPKKSPDALKSLLQNAPPNLPDEYKNELKILIEKIETLTRNESTDKIRASIIKLQKMK